jgi:hypothetical protein
MKKKSPRRASHAENFRPRADAPAIDDEDRRRPCAGKIGESGSAREPHLAPARPMRLPAQDAARFDDFHTESALAITRDTFGEPIASRFRQWAEKIDPRGQRDVAIRALAELLRQPSVSATAKVVEAELRGYLAGAWRRGERDLLAPPAGSTARRQNVWRIAKLNGGDSLSWRRILEIIDIAA